MHLSKNEEKVYSLLKNNGLQVFKTKDLALLLNISKTKTYNLIKALKKKNVIEVLSSGIYSLREADDFVVGAYFNWPSYLSFLSALNYYGFSDNMPRKITFVSTNYKKSSRFEYICLSPKRFFGYTKVGDIILAEKEKAFVDSLLLPKCSGGIKEISRSLVENFEKIDENKLVKYALEINNKMVLRRLGFILEKKLSKKNKKILLKKKGKGPGLLDPNIKKREKLNKRWLLYTELE